MLSLLNDSKQMQQSSIISRPFLAAGAMGDSEAGEAVGCLVIIFLEEAGLLGISSISEHSASSGGGI